MTTATATRPRKSSKSDEKEQVLVKASHIEQQVIKCVARESFSYQGVEVAAGETFYLSKSGSKDGYHIVRWDAEMNAWACSCGAHTKAHAHNRAVNTWIATRVVLKQSEKPETTAPSSGDSYSLPVQVAQVIEEVMTANDETPEDMMDEDTRNDHWTAQELARPSVRRSSSMSVSERICELAPLHNSRRFSILK